MTTFVEYYAEQLRSPRAGRLVIAANGTVARDTTSCTLEEALGGTADWCRPFSFLRHDIYCRHDLNLGRCCDGCKATVVGPIVVGNGGGKLTEKELDRACAMLDAYNSGDYARLRELGDEGCPESSSAAWDAAHSVLASPATALAEPSPTKRKREPDTAEGTGESVEETPAKCARTE